MKRHLFKSVAQHNFLTTLLWPPRFRESEDGIIGNFTFKFPPGVGQYYHLPTYSSVVATGQDGLWMTEFKGGQNR